MSPATAIYIDADACPVKAEIYRVAERYGLKVYVVSNSYLGVPRDPRVELVVVPVSDVDRAKAFYVDKVGFHLDHDVQPGNGMRVVQLTPPGSACFTTRAISTRPSSFGTR